jgi:YHS domain-containing protein
VVVLWYRGAPRARHRAYGKPRQALEVSASENPLEALAAQLNGTAIRPAEFGSVCAMGLALGKAETTDRSVCVQVDGAAYYFANEAAKTTFMEDPQGNLTKARARYMSR